MWASRRSRCPAIRGAARYGEQGGSKVPVPSEAARRRLARHASVGSCVGVARLALRHAALLCTVLPRITSTIDPNALDAEPIKRPLVRLRHLPAIPAVLALSSTDRSYISSSRAETRWPSLWLCWRMKYGCLDFRILFGWGNWDREKIVAEVETSCDAIDKVTLMLKKEEVAIEEFGSSRSLYSGT